MSRNLELLWQPHSWALWIQRLLHFRNCWVWRNVLEWVTVQLDLSILDSKRLENEGVQQIGWVGTGRTRCTGRGSGNWACSALKSKSWGWFSCSLQLPCGRVLEDAVRLFLEVHSNRANTTGKRRRVRSSPTKVNYYEDWQALGKAEDGKSPSWKTAKT